MNRFRVGMVFTEKVRLTEELVVRFAEFSGDRNPVHLEGDAAREYGYSKPFAHGAILSAIVSKIIGMKVPGPGAVWIKQSMEWTKPVFVGEAVTVEAEIAAASTGAEMLTLELRAMNSSGETVMQGSADVKLSSKIADSGNRDSEDMGVALVTGGSRGIGAAIARELGCAGYSVVLTYNSNRAAATSVMESIVSGGAACEAIECDLSRLSSGIDLVKEIKERFGRVDAVVHAATQALPGSNVIETEINDLQKFFRIHLDAAIEIAHAVAPEMASRKFGRFIFMGTSALLGPAPANMAPYVIAKQALWGLTRCLATELGPDQITANMISPGMTITDLTAGVPQRAKEIEARRTALRRLAVPEDIAKTAVFLASRAGSYVTGQNLQVTGVGS